jgi:hypothetical protein
MKIQKVGTALATGSMFVLTEAGEAAKNDPALAMRIAATSLTDTLLNKVNTPIKDSFAQNVVPIVRGGILALNAVRAHQTFKSPESTNLDKFMDTGRVISDIVGFAGGVMAIASPAHLALGQSLMGFSYGVDAVSHAYRGLGHAGKRISVWNTKLEQLKESERQKEQEQHNGPGAPQEPPANPTNPPAAIDAKQVQVCIKGTGSAAADFLKNMTPQQGLIAG